ncbi:MAG: hypothetical protein ACK5IJ_05575 [Mangrovibacterium sp.]
MNTKEVQALESYFKTENEHWNGYAFEMICEVLQKGNFENPETPLKLFSKAVDVFTERFETPLKAVQMFEAETDKQKLDTNQKLFVFEWVLKYVKYSEFEKADTDEIKDLLKSQTERLKAEINKLPEYNKPLTGNIRDTLKDLMQKELKQLPETLKELDPVQRLNILCKLMPYVLPKTESVKHTLGEPEPPKKNWFD